jgi:hypothetical protein
MYRLLHQEIEKTMEHQHWRTHAFDGEYLSLTIICNSFEPALCLYILQPSYIMRDIRIISMTSVGIQTRNKWGGRGPYWHPDKPVILVCVTDSLMSDSEIDTGYMPHSGGLGFL